MATADFRSPENAGCRGRWRRNAWSRRDISRQRRDCGCRAWGVTSIRLTPYRTHCKPVSRASEGRLTVARHFSGGWNDEKNTPAVGTPETNSDAAHGISAVPYGTVIIFARLRGVETPGYYRSPHRGIASP